MLLPITFPGWGTQKHYWIRTHRMQCAPDHAVATSVRFGSSAWKYRLHRSTLLDVHENSTHNRCGATATGEELRQFARSHLAHFKVPHSYTFVQELPKTATGKIQKYVLRRQQGACATP